MTAGSSSRAARIVSGSDKVFQASRISPAIGLAIGGASGCGFQSAVIISPIISLSDIIVKYSYQFDAVVSGI